MDQVQLMLFSYYDFLQSYQYLVIQQMFHEIVAFSDYFYNYYNLKDSLQEADYVFQEQGQGMKICILALQPFIFLTFSCGSYWTVDWKFPNFAA